jgi:glycosyltransferase involved in cell wall biosynthesis
MTADITVCVLSLNRGAFLREALDSVFAQTVAPKRIVVFDNGSKPDVKEAMVSYLDRGVQWADATRNFFWNFKRATASIQTEYVVLLHDDDRLCADFIEKQTGFLEANTGISAVTCNAHLINESGVRNGAVLRPQFVDMPPETYRSGVDVALCYAGDSCLPFSPMTYRADYLRKLGLQEGFGKVADAVFFCELSEMGPLAYQSQALYECRVHGGQDSSAFPDDALHQLNGFFRNIDGNNAAMVARLHRKLLEQETARVLRRFFFWLTDKKTTWSDVVSAWRFNQFSVWSACMVVGRVLAKKVRI